MVDILEFIKQFLYEIIFTFLLSSGFFALYLKKFKNKIDTHNLGITRIHKLGKSPKQMIKAIEGARKIMQL